MSSIEEKITYPSGKANMFMRGVQNEWYARERKKKHGCFNTPIQNKA